MVDKIDVAQYTLAYLKSKHGSIKNVEFMKILFEMQRLFYYIHKEDLFDDFYAMQRGPIESTIYNELETKLQYDEAVFKKIRSLDTSEEDLIEENTKEKSLEDLKKILENEKMSTDDLNFVIDYCYKEYKKTGKYDGKTHEYYSWRDAWKKAREYGRKSYEMNQRRINSEAVSFYESKSLLRKESLTKEEEDILEELFSE